MIKLSIITRRLVSAVKQPSSRQSRTKSRYKYTHSLYVEYVLLWLDDGCFTAETCRLVIIDNFITLLIIIFFVFLDGNIHYIIRMRQRRQILPRNGEGIAEGNMWNSVSWDHTA